MDYIEQAKALREKYNARLKAIKTYNDLESLISDMYNEGEGLIFRIKSKSGGVENGISRIDDDTIEYITDQDNRVRKCKVANLYKYWEVV